MLYGVIAEIKPLSFPLVPIEVGRIMLLTLVEREGRNVNAADTFKSDRV